MFQRRECELGSFIYQSQWVLFILILLKLFIKVIPLILFSTLSSIWNSLCFYLPTMWIVADSEWISKTEYLKIFVKVSFLNFLPDFLEKAYFSCLLYFHCLIRDALNFNLQIFPWLYPQFCVLVSQTNSSRSNHNLRFNCYLFMGEAFITTSTPNSSLKYITIANLPKAK